MTLIFLNSPVQLFDSVIPFIEERKLNDITFVAPLELEKFFKKYYSDSNVIIPSVHPNLITAETKYKILSNTRKAKKEFIKLFLSYKDENVFVFFTTWSITYFYYINELRKNGNKIIIVKSKKGFEYEPSADIQSYILQKYIRYALGVPNVITRKACGLPICQFLVDKIEHETIELNDIELKNIPDRFRTKEYNNMNIIFACNGKLEGAGVDTKSVTKITNILKEILDKKYPYSYVIKTHPRDREIYGNMQKAKKIDPDIIFETMLFHEWKYVIGYYSTVLVRAKKYTNAKVISLINLFKWDNEKLKNYWITRFSNEEIFMPKTIQELDDLII